MRPVTVEGLLLGLAFAATLWALPATVRAEARPASRVTGLEIGLDGATRAYAGGSLRWFFTLYEVVGHDALRPARAGRLRVLSSHAPAEAVADLRTDRYGRASATIPIPAGSAGTFEVIVEASAGRARRTLRTNVTIVQSGEVQLVADRGSVQVGEALSVIGRAVRLPDRRPLPGQEVTVRFTDEHGRALGEPRELHTGPSGAFVASTVVPEGVASVRATAAIEDVGSNGVTVSVSAPSAPRMVVRAVPRATLVSPAAEVPVDVMVRRADGRPVRGARVRLDGAADPAPVTDDAGRAELLFEAPAAARVTSVADSSATVSVTRAGLGSAETTFSVRVFRQAFQVGLAVEGGSLAPDLPSRVFVRVARPSGAPARGILVHLDSPLLGSLEGRTGDDGVVALDARPRVGTGIEGRDRCGGATASAATITVAEGDETVELERCLPVDPDATVRPRPARHALLAGEELQVELHVARGAARHPVEVVLLRRSPDGLVPIARQVVPARSRTVAMSLPEEASGEVVVRARPLVGAGLEPVRGGTATVWLTAGRPVGLELRSDGAEATMELSEQRSETAGALLVVPADGAAALEERVDLGMRGLFARIVDDPSGASGPALEGWLASRTARDDAAPAVLRGRTVVVVSAPGDPPSFGVLRDPVRARSRFVRGRLALVVRSLEQRLNECIPDSVDDVGVRGPRGWSFNREALVAVVGAHLLEGRVPRTLGGEPLSLADLEAFDRTFTFDNMARRVTRQRLFSLLVRLREFVRERELDLWQQGTDPGPWLDLLIESAGLEEAALHDAWGRRVEIRRAPGGRARFSFLAPLPPGFELVSAGPDGRFGTGDDVVDPFARILPSGSAYAEAVGEDDLLARLNRVELSQATLDAVAVIFSLDDSGGEGGDASDSGVSWAGLPEPQVEQRSAAHFERSWIPLEPIRGSFTSFEGTRSTVAVAAGEEPRALELVAVAWSADGWVEVTRQPIRVGFPVVFTAEPLSRLRPDEPLRVPVVVARLPDGPERLVLAVEGSGSVRAELEGGGSEGPVRLGPGGAAEIPVRVVADEVGSAAVRFRLRDAGSGGGREIVLPLHVGSRGSLRVQPATAAISGATTLRVELPRDAVEARGALVLASPTAFASDPSLSRWADEDPAVVAWAMSIAGQDLPSALVRSLEASTGRDGAVEGETPAVSAACATVAWAAATEGVSWAQRATATYVGGMAIEGPDDRSRRSRRAAALAALSVAAAPPDGSPLSARIDEWRDDLRAAVRSHREDRALLARGAAALLLSDTRDVRGRTMLALAREHLAPGFRGGLVVAIDDEGDDAPGRGGAEELVATAALAIAAHQAEEPELAADLARGLSARAHVATELGGEPLFWFLAARAFGVFGSSEGLEVTVAQGSDRQVVELGTEAVVLPLELPRPGRSATVRITLEGEAGAVPLARTLARYVRPARPSDAGPLQARIDGDPGFVSERAALVVVLENTDEARIERPELLIEIPAGAELDGVAQGAMARAEGVAEVLLPDRRGVVRVRLEPMEGGATIRLPVPCRWTAAGPRQGLSLAAFPADRSWELSVTPPAEIDVTFRPEVAP